MKNKLAIKRDTWFKSDEAIACLNTTTLTSGPYLKHRLERAFLAGAKVNSTKGLTFNELREANLKRIPLFKNKHGEFAHSKPDGSDWSPAQWLQAVMGELGEYANKRKKFERGDLTESEFICEAKKELADVQTYLDILAYQFRIDLGQATIDKFNEVSDRIGVDVKLYSDD